MKRAILVTLSIIAVCSLCLAGTANAAKAGYGFHIDFGTDVTIDGKWTATDEWSDCYIDFFYSGWTKMTTYFADKWDMTPNENWLIEALTDTTSNAGDFFQLSYDLGSGTYTDPIAPAGGAAPTTTCFLINITGHTPAVVQVFVGTGTGWAASSAVAGTDYTVSQSMAASAKSATPHWIIEIRFLKTGALALGYNNNPRVAVYDASNAAQGVLMWPPYSDANVPNTYGLGATEYGMNYPEGLTIGVMVALSSVAVIVSSRYFRKRSRIESCSSWKP